MEKTVRRRYTVELKEAAVSLVTSQGYNQQQTDISCRPSPPQPEVFGDHTELLLGQ